MKKGEKRRPRFRLITMIRVNCEDCKINTVVNEKHASCCIMCKSTSISKEVWR